MTLLQFTVEPRFEYILCKIKTRPPTLIQNVHIQLVIIELKCCCRKLIEKLCSTIEMDCLVVMTEAQFTMTIHAVESSSLGRCDQRRQCLPLAQIDKPDQTQEMDITGDSRAEGNQWCRQFSASLITVHRLIQAIAP